MIGKPYRVVPKGWGRELWLANSPLYCGKLLKIMPGKQCSYHYHKQKVETLYLAEGRLAMFLDDDGVECVPHVMEVGSLITIQPYQRHGFRNIGDSVAVLFEVSTQHHEDDSIRMRAGDTNGKA